MRKAINGCIGKLIGMLKRKAKTWRNVPFKESGSISVSATISIAIFSFSFEVNASIPSILECERRETEGKSTEESA